MCIYIYIKRERDVYVHYRARCDGKEVKGVEGKRETRLLERSRSLQRQRSQKQKVDPCCTLHAARRLRYDGRTERLLEAEEAPL